MIDVSSVIISWDPRISVSATLRVGGAASPGIEAFLSYEVPLATVARYGPRCPRGDHGTRRWVPPVTRAKRGRTTARARPLGHDRSGTTARARPLARGR